MRNNFGYTWSCTIDFEMPEEKKRVAVIGRLYVIFILVR